MARRKRCDNCHWGQWFTDINDQIDSAHICTECYGFDKWIPKKIESNKCSCPEDLGQCVHCQELKYKV